MLYSIFILLCCPFLGSALETQRDQKSFSLFSVLKWQNSACQAVSDDSLQGVCYTKQECDDLGGTEDGNCAAGFGTCCVISLSGTANSPGGTVTQNCTFIQNVDYPSAETNTRNYEYMVTKCSSDICQVRLDFLVANFAQPDQATGDCALAGSDRDTITLDAGGDDPNHVVCGELTGQHAYLDVSPANTNAATITIATHANAASGGTKNWRIKVSQIECDSAYRAPQGCLQYFFENINTITSFNYDGNIGRAGTEGGVLANQDYRICIKQNPGMCSIEYTESMVGNGLVAFDLNALASIGNTITSQHRVAGGTSAANQGCATIIANAGNADHGLPADGTNYIQIPGAQFAAFSGDTFCGGILSNFVLDPAIASNMAGSLVPGAVIATGIPFEIRYVAYGPQALVMEMVNGAMVNQANAGFSIQATQKPCGINPTGGIQIVQ